MEKLIDKVFDKSLIQEMVDYGRNKKAEAVYMKCLRAKKWDLADRIKAKYNLFPNRNTDTTTAFGLACFAMKNRNNG
tara:strand:- start:1928 stop:2158 length:231 start_codon:yes stop_codon:yes gene_type:complete